MPAQPSKGVHQRIRDRTLLEQYEVCLTALDAIIKRAFEILETSPDNQGRFEYHAIRSNMKNSQ